MVKGYTYIVIVLLLIIVSCSTKNEYGYSRVSISRFKITPYKSNEVYNFLDTNSIYKIVGKEYKNATGTTNNEFYKIYSHGRIGHYYGVLSDFIIDKTFESKKGQMGYYEYNNQTLVAKFYYDSWHGNGFQTDTLKIRGDTISVIQNYDDAFIKTLYRKEILPIGIKAKKPDW